jgi:hypothetical protein
MKQGDFPATGRMATASESRLDDLRARSSFGV